MTIDVFGFIRALQTREICLYPLSLLYPLSVPQQQQQQQVDHVQILMLMQVELQTEQPSSVFMVWYEIMRSAESQPTVYHIHPNLS